MSHEDSSIDISLESQESTGVTHNTEVGLAIPLNLTQDSVDHIPVPTAEFVKPIKNLDKKSDLEQQVLPSGPTRNIVGVTGRTSRKRTAVALTSLNDCYCGNTVIPNSLNALACSASGCETIWVRSTIHILTPRLSTIYNVSILSLRPGIGPAMLVLLTGRAKRHADDIILLY